MLKDLQHAMLRALCGDAPLETIRNEAASLAAEERACIERMDPEGFLLSSLLVRKLRFERICGGDASMEEWFKRDPGGFTEVFRAYNREMPPTEFFPRQEALEFRRWCRERGAGP